MAQFIGKEFDVCDLGMDKGNNSLTRLELELHFVNILFENLLVDHPFS